MAEQSDDFSPELLQVSRRPESNGIEEFRLETDEGAVPAHFQPPAGGVAAYVAVIRGGGVREGLNGPARGLYPRRAAWAKALGARRTGAG